MDNKAASSSTQAAPSHTWLTGSIVVGIDGSDHSAVVLRRAEQLAVFGGADIEVVIAWQLPVAYGPVAPPIEWSPGEDAQKALDKTMAAVFGDDVPENVSAFVREGPAAEVLISASQDADLLVVGGRVRGALMSALLGTVSSECAERANCAVLVVHESSAGSLRHTA